MGDRSGAGLGCKWPREKGLCRFLSHSSVWCVRFGGARATQDFGGSGDLVARVGTGYRQGTGYRVQGSGYRVRVRVTGGDNG